MAPRWCIYLAHRWRWPKVMSGLLILELPCTIVLLLLFGIADGDTYRKKLWLDGSNHGFNSNPNEILYQYANYQPIHVPLIWSSRLTHYDTVIVVLSMFILLCKSTMFVLSALLPIFSIIMHAALIALYAVSVKWQSTPDLSNRNVPDLQTNLPWYLGKGCSYASTQNYGYCLQSRAAFAVTTVMLAIFVVDFFMAIHSAIITREEKAERLSDWEEEKDLKQYEEAYDPDEEWEVRRQRMFADMPRTPTTPWSQSGVPLTTPRTTAFNKLSGAADGAGTGASRSGTMPARPLAFRAMYGEMEVPDAPI